jgi:hypothetical protein
VRLIWLVRFVATRPSILYIPPQCHQSRMEVIGTRVVSPIIIHNSTVYGLRLHPSSQDRGPVDGKPGRRNSRKDQASATLWPGGGSHFVSFKIRSIMGIHLGTMLRKCRGSGGRVF